MQASEGVLNVCNGDADRVENRGWILHHEIAPEPHLHVGRKGGPRLQPVRHLTMQYAAHHVDANLPVRDAQIVLHQQGHRAVVVRSVSLAKPVYGIHVLVELHDESRKRGRMAHPLLDSAAPIPGAPSAAPSGL